VEREKGREEREKERYRDREIEQKRMAAMVCVRAQSQAEAEVSEVSKAMENAEVLCEVYHYLVEAEVAAEEGARLGRLGEEAGEGVVLHLRACPYEHARARKRTR
jgi:hypothetical protein